jgi:transposase
MSEYSVRLRVRIRRFRCLNPECCKRTFTERLPQLVASYAHKTFRLSLALQQAGCFLSGEAGARLLEKLRMETSGDTLLRLLRSRQLTSFPTPRILGVDDWAKRKGRTYGTILVDLERHQVVDLLPDRTADTLAYWLRTHPGVAVIARDRSTEYARGASEGAPDAVQVADRWHLLLNARQMLERYLSRIYGSLKQLPRTEREVVEGEATSSQPSRTPFPRTKDEMKISNASRDRRLELYETIQCLKQEGKKIKPIAEQLNLHRETVRKFYYAAAFPERSQRKPAASILDPYLPYLEKRFSAGCENAAQLWREICQQGYPGSTSQVHKWMQQKRTRPAASTPKRYLTDDEAEFLDRQRQQKHGPRVPSVKELAWLLVKEPEKLTEQEQSDLEWVKQDAHIATLYQFVQEFAAMIRQRRAEMLDKWLQRSATSNISCLVTFASGIKQDYDAVRAALETMWSNGQAEGQTNRPQSCKRQMYV